jgi:opacity protein-like surface antigen
MKFIAALTAFTLATSMAYSEPEPDYLKTKALSFSFNGLNLSGFNGGVGGKIWLTDTRALTLSVDGSVNSRVTDATDSNFVDEEYSRSDVNLVVAMEQHVDLGRGFSPFLVGGLSFGYDQTEDSYGSIGAPYQNRSRSTNLGLRAGVGLEYWLTRRISLAGQQLITGNVWFGSVRSGTAGAPLRDRRSYDLGLGSSSLILSVYL